MTPSSEGPPALDSAIEDRLIRALECTGPEREAQIDALCARFPEAAAAIRSYVAAMAAGGRSTPEVGERLRDALAAVRPSVARYRIVEKLGSGSHGDVWLAEQLEPVRRDVALKVLRAEIRSEEVVARFDAERQALALLDHPGIAKILDAGTTADGRPFVAITLVPSARSILEFCIQERLPLTARLGLFVALCDAVQHAHARGILHRDLKPANVLCAQRDGAVAPVVIDFGIAKATGGRLTDLALRTAPGSSIGTPRYASPEQARGSIDIDIRSDVHALGAILHELLCGEPPFEEFDLGRLYAEDRARYFDIVVNHEPQPPSRRLAAHDGPGDRFGEPRIATLRRVRGDLDAITTRATARDRHRRYPTVSELAADVRRHLAGEPVLAQDGRLTYRLGVWIRRHRVASLATIVAILGIVGGLLVSLWLIGRLDTALQEQRQIAAERDDARRDAVDQRDRADRAAAHERRRAEELAAAEIAARERAAEAERTSRRLQLRVREYGELRRVLRHAVDSLRDGGEPTVDRLCDRLIRALDGGEAVFLPGVEAELRQTTGWLLAGLGRHDEAQTQFESALALHGGDDADARLARAEVLHGLADETGGALDTRTQIEFLDEAVGIYAELLGEHAPETLMARGDLGFLRFQAGNLGGSLDAMRATSAALFGDGGEERFRALTEDITRLAIAGDADAAARRLDEALAPAIDQPLFRARLCNVLWAASMQIDALAPLLLRAAVRYGERFNGRGHQHVMLARASLLRILQRRVLADADTELEQHAEWLAHAFEQQRLSAIVPRRGPDIGSSIAFDVARSVATGRELLTAHRGELLQAIARSGILDADDLQALDGALQR